MSEPAIVFRGVEKSFDPVQALIDFSHAFETGQTHALMGRNGSGKSTAIKILGRVCSPPEERSSSAAKPSTSPVPGMRRPLASRRSIKSCR